MSKMNWTRNDRNKQLVEKGTLPFHLGSLWMARTPSSRNVYRSGAGRHGYEGHLQVWTEVPLVRQDDQVRVRVQAQPDDSVNILRGAVVMHDRHLAGHADGVALG